MSDFMTTIRIGCRRILPKILNSNASARGSASGNGEPSGTKSEILRAQTPQQWRRQLDIERHGGFHGCDQVERPFQLVEYHGAVAS
jgi:hypothetical protein